MQHPCCFPASLASRSLMPCLPLAAATPQMRSPTMWLGISGGFLMCILLYMGIKGALIIGIA